MILLKLGCKCFFFVALVFYRTISYLSLPGGRGGTTAERRGLPPHDQRTQGRDFAGQAHGGNVLQDKVGENLCVVCVVSFVCCHPMYSGPPPPV